MLFHYLKSIMSHLKQELRDLPFLSGLLFTSIEELIEDDPAYFYISRESQDAKRRRFMSYSHRVLQLLEIHTNLLIRFMVPDAPKVGIRDIPKSLLEAWCLGAVTPEMKGVAQAEWMSLPEGLSLERYCRIVEMVMQSFCLSISDFGVLFDWENCYVADHEELYDTNRQLYLYEQQLYLHAVAKLNYLEVRRMDDCDLLTLHDSWMKSFLRVAERRKDRFFATLQILDANAKQNEEVNSNFESDIRFLKQYVESGFIPVDHERLYTRCIEIHWKGPTIVSPSYLPLLLSSTRATEDLVEVPKDDDEPERLYRDMQRLQRFVKAAEKVREWNWTWDPPEYSRHLENLATQRRKL